MKVDRGEATTGDHGGGMPVTALGGMERKRYVALQRYLRKRNDKT